MKIIMRHLPLLLAVMLTAGCGAVRAPAPDPGHLDAEGADPSAAPQEKPAAEPVELIEEFWEDGTPRIRSEVIRDENGEPVFHGTYARWHPNGEKEYEVVFDHGRKDGRAVRYHRSGKVWIEEFYVLGLKEGACRTWNEAGDLVKEEQFAGGKPHGAWTVWKKGVVRARSCFDHGVPVDCPPESPAE